MLIPASIWCYTVLSIAVCCCTLPCDVSAVMHCYTVLYPSIRRWTLLSFGMANIRLAWFRRMRMVLGMGRQAPDRGTEVTPGSTTLVGDWVGTKAFSSCGFYCNS